MCVNTSNTKIQRYSHQTCVHYPKVGVTSNVHIIQLKSLTIHMTKQNVIVSLSPFAIMYYCLYYMHIACYPHFLVINAHLMWITLDLGVGYVYTHTHRHINKRFHTRKTGILKRHTFHEIVTLVVLYARCFYYGWTIRSSPSIVILLILFSFLIQLQLYFIELVRLIFPINLWQWLTCLIMKEIHNYKNLKKKSIKNCNV